MRVVLTSSLVGLAVGILLVWAGAASASFGTFWAIAAMIGAGLSVGASATLLPAILAEALGLEALRHAVGHYQAAWIIGGGIGPFVTGQIFDHTGTYTLAFEFCAICMLIAACTAVMIKPAEGLVPQPVPGYNVQT